MHLPRFFKTTRLPKPAVVLILLLRQIDDKWF
jgi:hypothetical protein